MRRLIKQYFEQLGEPFPEKKLNFETGKQADLVVLDQNLLNIVPIDIGKYSVILNTSGRHKKEMLSMTPFRRSDTM